MTDVHTADRPAPDTADSAADEPSFGGGMSEARK